MDAREASHLMSEMIRRVENGVTGGLTSNWEAFKLLRSEGYSPEQIFDLFKLIRELGLAIEESKPERVFSPRAEGILKECRKPGADFAELAKKHSEGPSGPRGGDLDFFAREKMVPPFSQAAFAMKKGEISDIVETQFGYHIIKVTDKREARTLSFEDVEKTIRIRLKTQKRQMAMQKFITELKKKAKIVYPEGKEPPKPPTMGMPR